LTIGREIGGHPLLTLVIKKVGLRNRQRKTNGDDWSLMLTNFTTIAKCFNFFNFDLGVFISNKLLPFLLLKNLTYQYKGKKGKKLKKML